jgi:hypothetical protein
LYIQRVHRFGIAGFRLLLHTVNYHTRSLWSHAVRYRIIDRDCIRVGVSARHGQYTLLHYPGSIPDHAMIIVPTVHCRRSQLLWRNRRRRELMKTNT